MSDSDAWITAFILATGLVFVLGLITANLNDKGDDDESND